MNPVWWTRLCDAVGAILRHPYKRVVVDLPAYAGWGDSVATAPPPRSARLDVGEALRERLHGRLDERTLTYADGTDYLAAIVSNREDLARAARQRRETAEEALRSRNNSQAPAGHEVRISVSGGMACPRPEMMVRVGSRDAGIPPPHEEALRSAQAKAMKAAVALESVAYVTPDEWQAVSFSVAMRFAPSPRAGSQDLFMCGVRLEIRPTPAENARRYTSEGGTW